MQLKNKAYKALIVEDDKLVQEVHKKLLETIYSVEAVDNGDEALKVLQEKEFDLIVTDINMPLINGIELTKQIRQLNNKNKNAVIIGVTVKETAHTLWSGAVFGMNAIFTKPIELKKIQEVVEEVLRSR